MVGFGPFAGDPYREVFAAKPSTQVEPVEGVAGADLFGAVTPAEAGVASRWEPGRWRLQPPLPRALPANTASSSTFATPTAPPPCGRTRGTGRDGRDNSHDPSGTIHPHRLLPTPSPATTNPPCRTWHQEEKCNDHRNRTTSPRIPDGAS
ncbi:hypothetical protein SVIO_072530 [Streptomyces violaceusniger]|uniref:Uncharacterized protein n=1 Tax=Streptomyces violaceusniger TaxID=68280 RepID=A0A4D4LC38_STRVO|nr:hypothetical protein SVIO_072530 [Streptomyces violaceusniger]